MVTHPERLRILLKTSICRVWNVLTVKQNADQVKEISFFSTMSHGGETVTTLVFDKFLLCCKLIIEALGEQIAVISPKVLW